MFSLLVVGQRSLSARYNFQSQKQPLIWIFKISDVLVMDGEDLMRRRRRVGSTLHRLGFGSTPTS